MPWRKLFLWIHGMSIPKENLGLFLYISEQRPQTEGAKLTVIQRFSGSDETGAHRPGFCWGLRGGLWSPPYSASSFKPFSGLERWANAWKIFLVFTWKSLLFLTRVLLQNNFPIKDKAIFTRDDVTWLQAVSSDLQAWKLSCQFAQH